MSYYALDANLRDLQEFGDSLHSVVHDLRKRVKALEAKKCDCASNRTNGLDGSCSLRALQDKVIDQLPYVEHERDHPGEPYPTPVEIGATMRPVLPDSLGWQQVAYWWQKYGWKVWQTTVVGGMVWVYQKNNVGDYIRGANTLMGTVRMVEAIIDGA